MQQTYIETFDDGPGGWIHCLGNGDNGVQRPHLEDGALVSRSPWWIDYNHAPPGAGYMHLLGALHTRHWPNYPSTFDAAGGTNRFIEGGFPTDFTNAKLTLRLRGVIDLRGTHLLFLMQAKVGDHTIGHLLTGQPFEVTPEWSEQTVSLTPDPAQWTCLGSRRDRTETYGWGEVAPVLRDLNVDILLVLYPVDVVPIEPVENPHLLKAGEEYAVDTSRLPQGYIAIDEIRIEFNSNSVQFNSIQSTNPKVMNNQPRDTRYLFIDTDRLRRWDTGIIQRFPQPEKVPITGLEPGGPGSCDARVSTIYGSVLQEDGRFRMWYGVMPDALSHEEDADHFYTAYAESDDGIHWHKPDLKITGQNKYPGNNLLSLPGVVMGVVPALPGTGAKYLAAVIHYGLEGDISEGFGYSDTRGTTIFASDDGLQWRQLTPAAIALQGDVACLVADPLANRYLLYQKVGLIHGFDTRRSFICMESHDGVHWEGYTGMGSWRESFVADDYDDLQSMQAGYRIADYYGMAIYRAGDTYISVEDIFQIASPLRFEFAQNPNGLYKFRLGYSHNGINWRHPKGRPVWMEPGKPGEWDAGFAVPANTFVEHDDHLLLYYGGSRYDHGWSIEVDFKQKVDVPLSEQRDSGRVMMARIRKDRFASLAAAYKGQVVVDAGRRQDGDGLFINALCPEGSIRVAVSEHNAKEMLPGFGFDACVQFTGDATRAPIAFRNARLADIPASTHLMLHFEIVRGDLFGYEWGSL